MSAQTLDTSFLLESAAMGFSGTVRALGKLLARGSGRLPAEVVISLESGKVARLEVKWSSASELEALDPGKFEPVVFDQARVVARVIGRLAQRELTVVRLIFTPTRSADNVGFDLEEQIEVQ